MAAWVIAAIQSVHDEAGFAAYQEEAGPWQPSTVASVWPAEPK